MAAIFRQDFLLLPASILLWFIGSILGNVTWKSKLLGYTHYPNVLGLTFIQFVVAQIVCIPFLLCSPNVMASLAETLQVSKVRCFIIGVAFTFGQLCTNITLSMSSVTVTHLIKMTEPILALTLGVILLKERVGVKAVIYICIMVTGISAASYYDSTFHIQGLIFGGLSSLLMVVRNLIIKMLIEQRKHTGLALFVLSNMWAIFLLLACLLLYHGENFDIELDVRVLPIGLCFALQHTMSYMVLNKIHLSTHACLNTIKRVAIILVSSWMLKTHLSILQLAGVNVAVISFYLYTGTKNKGETSAVGFQRFPWSLSPKTVFFVILMLINVCFTNINFNRITQPEKLIAVGMPTVRIIWPYSYGLNHKYANLLSNISASLEHQQVQFYCGGVKCWKSLASMSLHNVEVVQLKASELSDGTAISPWVQRHAIAKILSGPDFESYMHTAMTLAVLWKEGGTVLNLDLPVVNVGVFMTQFKLLKPNSCMINSTVPLGICNLRQKSTFVRKLMSDFVSSFNMNGCTNWPCHFDFKRVLLNTWQKWSLSDNIIGDISHTYSHLMGETRRVQQGKKFGLLYYKRTNNIGDEIQSIAAAHFLPRVDKLVYRDEKFRRVPEGMTLIMNAFWRDKDILFSALQNINPILVAVHLDPLTLMENTIAERKTYFQTFGPVGTRDLATLKTLNEFGIPAKFSGCLTLFINNPYKDIPKRNVIYSVDLPRLYVGLLPTHVANSVQHITHEGRSQSGSTRFSLAYSLLERYAQAKVVVTTRLHVALPCVAMGTPVIFFNLKTLHSATRNEQSPRLSGLTGLFHHIDTYNMTLGQVKVTLEQFNWENPPPNPNPNLVQNLTRTARTILGKDEAISDTCEMYNVGG